jgi:hypothetical protein
VHIDEHFIEFGTVRRAKCPNCNGDAYAKQVLIFTNRAEITTTPVRQAWTNLSPFQQSVYFVPEQEESIVKNAVHLITKKLKVTTISETAWMNYGNDPRAEMERFGDLMLMASMRGTSTPELLSEAITLYANRVSLYADEIETIKHINNGGISRLRDLKNLIDNQDFHGGVLQSKFLHFTTEQQAAEMNIGIRHNSYLIPASSKGVIEWWFLSTERAMERKGGS